MVPAYWSYNVWFLLILQEAERQVFDGHGRVIDGRVHLLELANTELEAK